MQQQQKSRQDSLVDNTLFLLLLLLLLVPFTTWPEKLFLHIHEISTYIQLVGKFPPKVWSLFRKYIFVNVSINI